MDAASVRPWTCLVVAEDSPLGLVVAAVNDLTRHLPEPGAPDKCPTCGADVYWPCRRFHDAAYVVDAANLPVEIFVPPKLHSRLPPSATRTAPQWPSRAPEEENDHG